jgi:uncharacterized cupredoxin-like copper-binding protein
MSIDRSHVIAIFHHFTKEIRMKKLIHISLLSLVAITGAAFAHGDDDHHASALGRPGDPAKVSRTVDVEMNDTMRFTPSSIAVKRGETIRFVVKNNGKLRHEMMLGSMKELKDHIVEMQKNPEMEHADPNHVTVDPGKTGEMVWQFTKTGKFDFACLQPGHFESGMKGNITVSKK